MANKPSVDFAAGFHADGSAASIVFTLATDPVGVIIPGGGPQVLLAALGVLPTAAPSADMSSGAGTISSASLVLGVLTVTFSSAPAAGYYSIAGKFQF